MIKVNLIPLKRKKKAKPIPTFLIIGVFVTIAALFIAGVLIYRASRIYANTQAQYIANESKLVELKEKIKAVENFEQLNKTFEKRTSIIEQLSKNKSVPVILLDEVSKLLPIGVWLDRMTVTGNAVTLNGYGFTNSDIVKFVDNIKASNLLSNVYLNLSKGAQIENVPLYQFSITFTIKV